VESYEVNILCSMLTFDVNLRISVDIKIAYLCYVEISLYYFNINCICLCRVLFLNVCNNIVSAV